MVVWRATGSVTDHAVDLRMIAYSDVETPNYGLAFDVRGELFAGSWRNAYDRVRDRAQGTMGTSSRACAGLAR